MRELRAFMIGGDPGEVIIRVGAGKVTVAVFLSKSTAVALTPGTFARAFLTTIGQVPQVIFSTAKVAVCGGAAKAPAASNTPTIGKELKVKRCKMISF